MTTMQIINIIGMLIWVLLVGSGGYLVYRGKKLNDKDKKGNGHILITIGCIFWLVFDLILAIITLVGGF